MNMTAKYATQKKIKGKYFLGNSFTKTKDKRNTLESRIHCGILSSTTLCQIITSMPDKG